MNRTVYTKSHANRINLLIHIVAVPLFWLASSTLLISLVTASWYLLPAALSGLAVSMAAQGLGHKLELVPPEPFAGPGDFCRRILSEQFYRFPAFVLSGRYWQALGHKPQAS